MISSDIVTIAEDAAVAEVSAEAVSAEETTVEAKNEQEEKHASSVDITEEKTDN